MLATQILDGFARASGPRADPVAPRLLDCDGGPGDAGRAVRRRQLELPDAPTGLRSAARDGPASSERKEDRARKPSANTTYPRRTNGCIFQYVRLRHAHSSGLSIRHGEAPDIHQQDAQEGNAAECIDEFEPFFVGHRSGSRWGVRFRRNFILGHRLRQRPQQRPKGTGRSLRARIGGTSRVKNISVLFRLRSQTDHDQSRPWREWSAVS